MTQFDVILADPPWSFRTWSAKGKGRSAERHYSVMSTDAICAYPIGDYVADNCALFLWTIWPCLLDAIKVVDAWGFQYRALAFDWVKSLKDGTGFHFGMGYYTRANTEPCLLAVKGRMPVAVHDVSSVIYSPAREHSRKPDEQYERIERLYPDMRYLEVFARYQRPGWTALGDEVGKWNT